MSIGLLARVADVSRTTARRYVRGLPISRKSRIAIERALAEMQAPNA